MTPATREALELFCEKAEKLRTSSLAARLNEHRPSFTWRAEDDSLTFTGPAAEETEAFILTFRFFIQDNERCSLRKLGDLAEKGELSAEWCSEVTEVRSALNDFLDSVPPIRSSIGQTPPPSYRDILWFLVYGDLAHVNPERRDQLKKYTNPPLRRGFVTTQFHDVLYASLVAIREIEAVTRHELSGVSSSNKR